MGRRLLHAWYVLSYGSLVDHPTLSSLGWSAAHSTAVFPFDLYSPTILELLVYWLHTAMLLDDTIAMPQVSDDEITEIQEKPLSLFDAFALHKEGPYSAFSSCSVD
jgi:hypothetical protein